MRTRAALGLLLATNCLLALGWWTTASLNARRAPRAALPPETHSPLVKTNFLVRRQFFLWQELESDDYPTYIKNLREIACPEQTIRDIIIADVNAVYARKRATEVVSPEQQWWRSLPDAEVFRIAQGKFSELEFERRGLLTQLLGTNWETGDLLNLPRPTRSGINLDGPILGSLPNDVKQAIQEITLRSADRMQGYIDAQRAAGLPLDPAMLVTLRTQTRTELAQVLTPPQIEEYLLRYASTATALRSEFGRLKYFEPTPEEFRAVFRATDLIDLQLQALAVADPAAADRRHALEDQRLVALKAALSPERFALFQSLHDPAYQDAYAAAVQAGTPEATDSFYAINRAAQDEQARIRAQTNLTSELMAIELKKAELEALKAAAQALGQDVPEEPKPEQKTDPVKVHTLKPGETLNFIAQLYGINTSDLQSANPGLDFSKIKGGESIKIPVKYLPLIPVPR